MRAILALTILLAAISVQAAAQTVLKDGDQLPILALRDQHDKPAAVPPSTRQLLVAADNSGAGLVTDLLDSMGANWLEQTQRVYLADIHKMPALVSRFVALPRLRDKPYPIVLGREEGDLAMFPRKKDCVTVIPVIEGKLGVAGFACSAEELRSAVQP